MKLSMWILKDYLQEFHPIAYIHSGERILRNVRLFSDAGLRVNTNVYLGSADDFIDGEEKKVICVHGQDMLLLATEDINEVFNRILDCFDFYNAWYDECINKIQQKCSIQDILELSRGIFHDNVMVADSSYLILNYLECRLPENIILTERQKKQMQFSETAQKNSTIPLPYILQTREDKRIYRNLEYGYNLIVDDEELPISIVNLFNKNILWGWVLESNTFTKCTEGKVQVLEVLGQLLEMWLSKDSDIRKTMEDFSNVFQKVFYKNNKEDCYKLERHLSNLGWSSRAKKKVLIIENTQADVAILSNLCYRLNSKKNSVACVLEEKAVLLCNLDMQSEKSFSKELMKMLSDSSCRAGGSYIFSDICQIREQKILAETALIYGEKSTGCVNNCEKYILPYLKDLIIKNSNVDFYHPAIEQLEVYDSENSTELVETLYCFLRMERNYGHTAKKMFVHRNTIQYRIEKIKELTELDLEDVQIRMHVLLSLWIKKENS